MKSNIYQEVTDRIVAQLEKGIIPWQQPWSGGEGEAISYVTRKPYSILNQMLLGMRAGEYLTFNQVKALGGHIKKGAKAGFVVFYSHRVVKEKKEVIDEQSGETCTKITEYEIPVLKSYNVFHIENTEGVESKSKIEANELNPIEEADRVISEYVERSGLNFHNDQPSAQAFYSPTKDEVVVPMFSQYKIVEEYYSTTFHELVHSTGAKHRLNRIGDGKLAAFGSEDYSREELVAEIGSAMTCNRLGIDNTKAFNNSVAYIQSWAKKLKEDNRAIVWAASRAEAASKYIMND